MKGDSTYIFIVIAVIVGIFLLVIFITSGGKFTFNVSKTECQAMIVEACRSGDYTSFRNIPDTCKIYYTKLGDCKQYQNDQNCNPLCREVLTVQ